MDTKWKSSLAIWVWSLFLTFALSGFLALIVSGTHFFHRDYFQTPEFQNELDQFAGYLSLFEINQQTIESAKGSIIVTKEEIDDYRNRNGSLDEQIADINNQYQYLIGQAETEEKVNKIKKERDSKIKDITDNYNNDAYISSKVKEEKEHRIEWFFKDKESYQSNFSRYQGIFTYNLKDSKTGTAYRQGVLEPKDMLFLTHYSIPPDYFLHSVIPNYEDITNLLVPEENGTVEGEIGIAKSVPLSSPILTDYKNYQEDQRIFITYIMVSLIFLILCFYLAKKAKSVYCEMEKWRPYYNKLPIDIRAFLFTLTVFGTIIFLFLANDFVPSLNENPVLSGGEFLISLVVGSVVCALALVQGKFFASEFKDWENVKKQWKKGLVIIGCKILKGYFNKAKHSLREAFLKQSTGRQLFILFTIVFGLGLAATLMSVHPVFIPFYMILLGLIGIPTVMVLINRLGYYNQIIVKMNELAAGKHGEDLPVLGDSELSTLAGNINLLKQGVIHSQSEQAKSERLKTELITNVSHDLRTPLTSIITYTELLKAEELSNEEKDAYLEIIDRKSKRLKVLIDDLFEISKMASGSMELKEERVDLNQLLQQALAEYDISETGLQFRVTKPDHPVYALVDGQKMWRVFENLIGNVLKYSLENTRVYISITTEKGMASITFKNVSKYELSANADELFERFKRGDTSRHTEGTGLGLAIVKSIIDLHRGSLRIETDGDLFKVVISLKTEVMVNES